jgi:hypothetical protein
MLHALPRLGFRWQPPDDVFIAVVNEGRNAGSNCSIPLLAWLLEAGCPVDWSAALVEAGNNPGLSPVVKAWLQERSKQG